MTADELDEFLTSLSLIAMEMIDICQRIIDACDERSAVRSWSEEMGAQIEAIARVHQALDR